ncbi:MAG: Sec-independent protein translocase protein TatB [Rhodanobacteraceae bacterium]
MFDISFGELLLIAVVALVVIGPERLPGAARTAGALFRRVRRGWDSVRSEVMRELEAEELRAQLREAQEAARAAMGEVREQANTAAQSLGNVAQDARNVMRPLGADANVARTAAIEPDETPERKADDHDRAG